MKRLEPARVGWPLATCLATALLSLLPLLRDRSFYMRGDTPTQFSPTWFHLGDLLRGGTWPIWLDPEVWAGGNYAAEALFGIYNPLSMVIWLVMSGSSNLVVGVYLVKAVVMMMLALGTYLVCREYGAARWSASVMSTVLPISGFTLYWDAASWAGGLIAFAYTPWVWWTFRRTMRGTMNPFWAFLVGALAITQGNPYGTLGVVVVGVAVLGEGLAVREWRGATRLLLIGGCVAALLPLVYLPLLDTSSLTNRDSSALIANIGMLRPSVGDLFGMSSPLSVPRIRSFGSPTQVPTTYFCWFLLPLLPWLRYDVLRRRWRELSGVGVLSLVFLLLSLGPSTLWLFRWPLRLVEYLYLGLAVALAVLLSEGLQTTRRRERTLAAVGLVVLSSWLTWSQVPSWHSVSVGGPLLLLALTAGLLVWVLWGPRSLTLLAVPLLGGTLVALAAQSYVFPVNDNLRGWGFPSDVATLRRDFADRDGTVLQFATSSPTGKGEEPWDNYLGGTMYHVADVQSVNAYAGMGYSAFTRRLCLQYNGFTRRCGYDHIWQPVAPGQPALADLMKLKTVVVQPSQAKGVIPPDDWTVDDRGNVVIVTRDSDLPYPGSRLSWATDGVEVGDARTVNAYREDVEVASAEGGKVVFALLAWPGYHATLDGHPIELRRNPAGLITIDLPAGSAGRLELEYQPPGLAVGLIAAGLGSLFALGLGVVAWSRRRRASATEQPADNVVSVVSVG